MEMSSTSISCTPDSEIEILYQKVIRNLADVNDPIDPILLPGEAWSLLHTRLKQMKNGHPFRIYWGTAPTGKPHLGYLVPLIKIAQLMQMGIEVKILLADVHALMDSVGSTPQLIEARTQYYQLVISTILQNLPLSLKSGSSGSSGSSNPTFVIGSSFQRSPEYISDLMKLMSVTTVKASQKAGAEVVKQTKDPYLGSVVYPLMQAIDEKYMDVEAELGGIDQRKIFMYAHDHLHKIGHSKIIYLMNAVIPSLTKSGKMTSTEPKSKIDFTDTEEEITDKIEKAFSSDGVTTGNGLLAMFRYIVFECCPQGFTINREEQYGGDVTYFSYNEMEQDFITKSLVSIDLKKNLIKFITDFIRPIRSTLQTHSELAELAYPSI